MMMIRVFPYSAIQFFTFERSKKLYDQLFGKNHYNNFIAGSTAGVCSVLSTYPLDLMRARLAYQITGEHKYKGIKHAFVTIYKNEGGVRAFYRGITPTLIGMIPYAGASFFTYNTLKDFMLKLFPNFVGSTKTDSDIIVLKTWASLLIGGFAGAISQTISFPMDVARRRMQLSQVLENPQAYKGVWSTLLYVYRKNGLMKGIYRGLSINYIRVIPQQAIAYTTYEFMRQKLDLNKKPR